MTTRVNVVAIMLLSLLAACGGSPDRVGGASNKDSALGRTSSALLNGSASPVPGVVQLAYAVSGGGGVECTGNLLNNQTIVTAGHCGYDAGFPSFDQDWPIAVQYWRPTDSNVYCLTPSCNPQTLHVHTNHNYGSRFDYSNDIAVIVSDTPFPIVSEVDFALIYDDRPSRTGGGLYVVGSNDQPSSDATTNYIYTANPDFSYSRDTALSPWFVVDGSQFPVCGGDSGGPLLNSSADLTLGVGSSIYYCPGGTNCNWGLYNTCINPADTSSVYYTGILNHYPFIDQWSTSGVGCGYTNSSGFGYCVFF
jgi:hypothetical protein